MKSLNETIKENQEREFTEEDKKSFDRKISKILKKREVMGNYVFQSTNIDFSGVKEPILNKAENKTARRIKIWDEEKQKLVKSMTPPYYEVCPYHGANMRMA